MENIKTPVFNTTPDWEKIEQLDLSYHLWADEYPCFYTSYIKLCAVKNKGLFVLFFSEEPQPKAVYTKRDEPVYKDSCMELFIQPITDDKRYVNFEINPNAAYLSEIGTCRGDRMLLSSASDIACETNVLRVDSGWSVELFIPDELISDCLGLSYSFASQNQLKLNAYKCGDETQYPHYSSLFFIPTPKPDYHRPEFFGTVKLIDEGEVL